MISLQSRGLSKVFSNTTVQNVNTVENVTIVSLYCSVIVRFTGRTDAEAVKLQNFGHLMQRTDSLEKILMLGKIEGRKRRRQQRIRWLYGITDSMEMSVSKLQEIVNAGKPGMLQSTGSKRVRRD